MIRKAMVEGGRIRGIPAADPRITAFKGIPFAAPPVGENRWRAPQPVIPWEGERDCIEFGPIAMQPTPGLSPTSLYDREWHVDAEVPMSEDCLYLNVWTPAKTSEERLPVYVWYFGGGLQVGYPVEMEFDGERLARRGIVVVTVNYRVNVFGFLAHPQLTKEQPDAPSNFGHLDQQAATRWVKRNITAFGGDPDNITIGGQSAGGGSVCAQLTSPQNEGLFQKAIIESGIFGGCYGPSFPAKKFSDDEAYGVKFFDFLGVKTLEEARALDGEFVRQKCGEFRGFFGTTVDGKFQTGKSTENLMQGRRLPVPLLITRTSDEFMGEIRADSMEQFREKVRACMGSCAEEYLALCGDDLETAVKNSRSAGLEVAVRALGRRQEQLGMTAPLYYGVFDAEIPGWDHADTFHSVDLWFFFETLAKCWRPFTGKHYDLARQMCNYWANFIRSGDPNGAQFSGIGGESEETMPAWKPYTTDEPNAMWFRDEPQPLTDKPAELMRVHTEAYLERFPIEK